MIKTKFDKEELTEKFADILRNEGCKTDEENKLVMKAICACLNAAVLQYYVENDIKPSGYYPSDTPIANVL